MAIKVLPEEYASDPERLARFEQEARAAAALNHPHIAVVHDIGTEGDIHFMVQEYLEGDTLREPLKKGALPLARALDLATEIAEALAAEIGEALEAPRWRARQNRQRSPIRIPATFPPLAAVRVVAPRSVERSQLRRDARRALPNVDRRPECGTAATGGCVELVRRAAAAGPGVALAAHRDDRNGIESALRRPRLAAASSSTGSRS